MDLDSLYDHLIVWLESSGTSSSDEQIFSGVAIGHVLNSLDSSHFDDDFLSKIRADADNWRVKLSNLKKVHQAIETYYSNVLCKTIKFLPPNLSQIAEHYSRPDMARLLQLVLGCAVNSPNKEKHIQAIMNLDFEVQQAVMTAIQELMDHEESSEGDASLGSELEKLRDLYQTTLNAKGELAQRVEVLENQVAELIEERDSLTAEYRELRETVAEKETELAKLRASGQMEKSLMLKHQVDELMEEREMLVTNCDELKSKNSSLEQQLHGLQLQCTELQMSADDAVRLRDELDELQHQAEKMMANEAQLAVYKKKVDELADVKKRCSDLEEKNESYLKQVYALEDQLKRAGQSDSQVDVYRKEALDAQEKLTGETKRADRSEFELKNVQDSFRQLEDNYEKLLAERDSLKATVEDLYLARLASQHNGVSDCQEDNVSDAGSDVDSLLTKHFSELELATVSPSMRDKLEKLVSQLMTRRASMSRLANGPDPHNDTVILNNLLQDARTRIDSLERELRDSNQKVFELESELREKNNALEAQGKTAVPMATVTNKTSAALAEQLNSANSRTDELEAKVTELEIKCASLQQMHTAAMEEKCLLEQKYRGYLLKARSIIRTLDPKTISMAGSQPEINALYKLVEEKETKFAELARENQQLRERFEAEIRLISGAWYKLATQRAKNDAELRLSMVSGLSPGQRSPQSFLARQRVDINMSPNA